MYQAASSDTFANSPGPKRARTAGSKNEGDWTCPNCGNVNFAFRMTCNMRKCSTPKPGEGGPVPAMGPGLYELAPSAQYVGGPGPGTPQALPNYQPQPAYAPQQMLVAAAAPYQTSAPVYPPQGAYVQAPAPGMMNGRPSYGAPATLDYGLQQQLNIQSQGGSAFQGSSDGPRKRRGGPDASEGDWVCPKCGNTNFAFRTLCNMRKCSEPRPAHLGPAPPQQQQFQQQQSPQLALQGVRQRELSIPHALQSTQLRRGEAVRQRSPRHRCRLKESSRAASSQFPRGWFGML
eukprot:jgi/Mesen1/1001/ME000120S00157